MQQTDSPIQTKVVFVFTFVIAPPRLLRHGSLLPMRRKPLRAALAPRGEGRSYSECTKSSGGLRQRRPLFHASSQLGGVDRMPIIRPIFFCAAVTLPSIVRPTSGLTSL